MNQTQNMAGQRGSIQPLNLTHQTYKYILYRHENDSFPLSHGGMSIICQLPSLWPGRVGLGQTLGKTPPG